MARFTDTIEINDEDVEVEVEYNIYGGYAPATMWQPAEYPEVEIEGVYYLDGSPVQEIGLDDYMSDPDLHERILAEAKEIADDAAADVAYEKWLDRKLAPYGW